MNQESNPKMFVLRVEGMDCADCALHLEKAAQGVPGVHRAEVSFATGRMRLVAEGNGVIPQVQAVARGMGYQVLPLTAAADGTGWRDWLRRHPRALPTAISGFLLMLALMVYLLAGPASLRNGLLIAAAIIGGYPVARAGWAALRATRRPDMNALMTIAITGALAIGEYAEAGVVVFLFSGGELLEALTRDRARGAIRALMALRPSEATRWTPKGEERVPVEALAMGDLVLIRPGERIPADGRIREGHSAVDQSPITGESMPVDKGPGDEVFAGTVNGPGALTVEVTRAASDSTLARIIHLVEEAQEQRAPSQRLVDRFAVVYTPAVVVGALLVATVPPILGLGPFLDWLYRALVLLVIACPCALVLSTPVAVVSGLTAAARAGILIKGGVYLEELARLRAVAFDKTGTLTLGEPRLVGGQCANHTADRNPQECPECLDLLAKAAAVEVRSGHPLARAVVRAAEELGVADRYGRAEAVESAPGRGVQGQVAGHAVKVGSHAYVHGEREEEDDPFCRRVDAVAARGRTAVVVEDVCCGNRAYGVVADTLRPEAAAVVGALKGMGIHRTVMLTGDNRAVAEQVARTAGVDEFRAELLPQQKVGAVADLLARYGTVAMVGDGVNDAPALARASVGIAMGAVGSDVALETADVALMGDDLWGVPRAVHLGRRTVSIIRENVAFSLATKAAFLVLAVAGLATLWMAVFADVGVSLLVILNGMRLLVSVPSRGAYSHRPEM
ncbi:MAG: cation-translocating P-type ATPase [Anaerolineae bacterium]|nr:cation-translocating P-type ATPase [Anaerolineae bacterium]